MRDVEHDRAIGAAQFRFDGLELLPKLLGLAARRESATSRGDGKLPARSASSERSQCAFSASSVARTTMSEGWSNSAGRGRTYGVLCRPPLQVFKRRRFVYVQISAFVKAAEAEERHQPRGCAPSSGALIATSPRLARSLPLLPSRKRTRSFAAIFDDPRDFVVDERLAANSAGRFGAGFAAAGGAAFPGPPGDNLVRATNWP